MEPSSLKLVIRARLAEATIGRGVLYGEGSVARAIARFAEVAIGRELDGEDGVRALVQTQRSTVAIPPDRTSASASYAKTFASPFKKRLQAAQQNRRRRHSSADLTLTTYEEEEDDRVLTWVMLYAVRLGWIEDVVAMVARNCSLVCVVDMKGVSPLLFTAYNFGQTATVAYLPGVPGVDVNCAKLDGWTPIGIAALHVYSARWRSACRDAERSRATSVFRTGFL